LRRTIWKTLGAGLKVGIRSGGAVAHDDELDSPGLHPPDKGLILVAAVLFEGGLAPLALLLGWLLGQRPLAHFNWNERDAMLGLVAAVPMLGLFLAALRWPIGGLARIKQILREALEPLLAGRPVTDLALLALAAGVGEEMLFRGVLQGALSEHLGLWEGLAAASLAFGLLHPVTPTYIVLAAVLGTYLGTLYIVTGNLLSVMVAHAVYDFVALWVLLRTLSDRADAPA
jgi:membrane protease YdiL (CAAX protease family)